MAWCYGSLTLFVAVVMQLLMIHSVSSQNITNEFINHKCNNTAGTYSRGSVFEKHLNVILRRISTLNLKQGFVYSSSDKTYYDRSKKTDPNTAFVLLQCRGDSYGSKCHSCFNTALTELHKRCPGNKGAIIWYDQCLLDISNVNSENRIHYANNFWINNAKNATVNPKMFEEKRKTLMKELIAVVSNPAEDLKGPLYAAGDTMIGTKKLYAMVQCTRDLFQNSCAVCLEYMIDDYEDCCLDSFGKKDCCNKAGVRAFGRSCNFRYEFYPFLRTPDRLL